MQDIKDYIVEKLEEGSGCLISDLISKVKEES